jgi:deoxyribodipyrimidine photo-lyase
MTAPDLDRALVWLRRDLRVTDHAALSAALGRARAVWCVFVFDTEILDALPSRVDRRVEFIWRSVAALRADLEALGGGLHVLHGPARDRVPALAAQLGVDAVFAARDHEPQAIARDDAVATALAAHGRALHLVQDQTIFEGQQVLTQSGGAFTVFTPYRNAWLKRVTDADVAERPVATRAAQLAPARDAAPIPSLEAMGFAPTDLERLPIPTGEAGARALLDDFLGRMDRYDTQRDYPAVKGPSYLSVHLRFGTVSIRTLVREARRRTGRGAEVWLSELIWRDFYFQILRNFPHAATGNFRREYDAVRFDGQDAWFDAWCAGRTGYPLVDAGMRQLVQSGYMHNRLRMVTASFLTKDLHIHWQRGDAWFARWLNDFDLAANNGGWQWAASTGCDAQPYFRIFNPVTQSEKFDPEARFIRRYVPELEAVPAKWIHAPWTMPPLEQQACGVVVGRDYPAPIVDHAWAREHALALYAAAKR